MQTDTKREENIIKVTIFGIPARHTEKRFRIAEEQAYGMLRPDEIKAMCQREKHFHVRYKGQAFETFTFQIEETAA